MKEIMIRALRSILHQLMVTSASGLRPSGPRGRVDARCSPGAPITCRPVRNASGVNVGRATAIIPDGSGPLYQPVALTTPPRRYERDLETGEVAPESEDDPKEAPREEWW